MAKIIDLPDGTEAEFPDSMSDDAIGEVLRKQFPAPKQPQTNTLGQQPSPTEQASPQSGYGITENPGYLEQFAGGAKHAWDRAAAGLESLVPGGRALSQSLGQPDMQQLVKQGGQFVKETGPASTIGQIAGDVAMTAPAALKMFKAVNAARGLLPATISDAALNAGYGALTADEGRGKEGAAWGGIGALAVPALGGALQIAGKVLPHVLGTTTGAGAESIKQAFKGGDDFVANMRGQVEPGTVVDAARQGVTNMRQQMYDSYAKSKGGWAGDTTPLDLKPISQAFEAANNKFSFQGMPQPGIAEVRDKVAGVLGHWNTQAQKNPAFKTVEGLDALKRHLQDIIPDNLANRAGRAYVTEVVNGVKNTINTQARQYADAMKEYWARSEQLDEITRALSLGDRATKDTALRKLQSLMRNNVNSNYGQRVQSANTLEQMGGVEILPQVAGQALNSWTPRGLQGLSATGIGGYSFANPVAAGSLPAFSPRMVGEAANAIGNTSRNQQVQAIIEALRRSAPAVTRSLNQDD